MRAIRKGNALVGRCWRFSRRWRRGSVTRERIARASIHLGGGDRLFEVEHLLASDRTELFQQSEVLARFVDLPGFDVELAQIFERALVLGIEIERLAVEGVGLLVIAGLA